MIDVTTGMEFQSAVTPTDGAAGTTDINGSICDMANFCGVLALVRMGTITASAVTSIKWQQGNESDMSDAADLEGTAITIADDDDEQVFATCLVEPEDRYVRIVVDRGTANAVVADAVYVRFNSRTMPTTIDVDDLVTFERHVTPAEGTA
jgi:hypothetical protein